jgi:HD-like signal output (HDOD) protein
MKGGDSSDVAERILRIFTDVYKVPLYSEYVAERWNMAQKLYDVILQKTENLKKIIPFKMYEIIIAYFLLRRRNDSCI